MIPHLLVVFTRQLEILVTSLSFFSDVAFEVGHGTAAPYLVLQVHYGKVDKFKGELVIYHACLRSCIYYRYMSFWDKILKAGY